MCGIYGLMGFPPAQAECILNAMGEQIRPRGPHGEGRHLEPGVAMGMRRLSIIDLEHGWQPLTAREGRIICFQNGEIYNYRALKGELESLGAAFRTQSDTEVLAQGYDRWGLDGLLERIDGMYAIAILDRDRRELILARDRFGEKPLYYSRIGERFAYSSDLRTLAALPGCDAAIDSLALERYLALHFSPGRRTIFSGIQRLLPGEVLRLSLTAPSEPVRCFYFVQPLGPSRPLSEDQLANLVEQSVTSRLVADVPVGVFLSGGLDSSVVAAVAARAQPAIATFSMGFSSASHDESEHARRVANHIGATHHHFEFGGDDFCALLPQVAAALDEPIGDQATLPLYWLCREAVRHVSVVLAGEGADEIFAGYGYYRPFSASPGIMGYLQRFRARSSAAPRFDRLIDNPRPDAPSGFPLLTDIAGREALLAEGRFGDDLEDWEQGLLDWLDRAADPLQRATAADLATWLPDDLLVKFDRMAMAHSLEGRAPFLAPALVDAALHLPGKQRLANGESKIALRRIARRWLPRSILERPKQGFVLPMRQWLGDWLQGHGGALAYLESRELPGLDRDALAALFVAEESESIPRERLTFALVLLSEWYLSASESISHLRRAYAGQGVGSSL